MAPKRRRRDPRYSRTLGKPPHAGRRYVDNEKVRIEWRENGRRRSRTIGPNSSGVRKRADATLTEILKGLGPRAASDAPRALEPVRLERVLRSGLLAVLDVADQMADVIRHAGLRPEVDEPSRSAEDP